MKIGTKEIRRNGKTIEVPVLLIDNKEIIITGKIIRIAQICDQQWLESNQVENPQSLIDALKHTESKADIFTFSQQPPEIEPKFDYYMEWDNFAAIEIKSYNHWFKKQIYRGARRSIKKSIKKGVVVKLLDFDDDLVKGISRIYDETPIRQGKPFWHYGKNHDDVRDVNITFLERSDFIGAFYADELIGFIKIVYVEKVAHMMQILSKLQHRDKSPTNALLAKAIEICAEKRISHLTYGNYVYHKKTTSSLTAFKRHNGFKKIDYPRYYVPLTLKGWIALKFKLHNKTNPIFELLPRKFIGSLLSLRTKFYAERYRQTT